MRPAEWKPSVWGTVLLTAINGVVGNTVHQYSASKTNPPQGVSGSWENPLDSGTPGQVAKVSYGREDPASAPTTAAPTGSFQISLKDDLSKNRQEYARDFNAPSLSPAAQAKIAQALSQLEKLVRDGNAEITGIHVKGLASPEGKGPQSVEPGSVEPENVNLAMQRARMCLDQGIGPALIKMGIPTNMIKSLTTLGGEEAQFSPEQYQALHALAQKHGFGGTKRDAVHRLVRAANDGTLQGVDEAGKKLLESTLDDARGAVVTIAYREKTKEPPHPSLSHAADHSPLAISFLIPAIIPWLRRHRPDPKESKPQDKPEPPHHPGPPPTDQKTPETPRPEVPQPHPATLVTLPSEDPVPTPFVEPSRSPEPSPTTPPLQVSEQGPEPSPSAPQQVTEHIPLPVVPHRSDKQTQIDVLYDLLVHFDAHPEVDYRRMLQESKRADSPTQEEDLTKRIVESWSVHDEEDYSSSETQQAYARAHARILLTLDAREPRDMDILPKIRAYSDGVLPQLTGELDQDLGRMEVPSEDVTRTVSQAIEQNTALYGEIIDSVRHDSVAGRQQTETEIKRKLEGRVLQLWSKLDGESYYERQDKRRWAAWHATELFRRGWGDTSSPAHDA